jgi:flagellar hook assembly protein FlgD
LIEYNLPTAGYARLTIFDVTGRVVTTLVEESSSAGAFTVPWDGRDAYGTRVASGVYFANLETSNEVVTGKIMVVR